MIRQKPHELKGALTPHNCIVIILDTRSDKKDVAPSKVETTHQKNTWSLAALARIFDIPLQVKYFNVHQKEARYLITRLKKTINQVVIQTEKDPNFTGKKNIILCTLDDDFKMDDYLMRILQRNFAVYLPLGCINIKECLSEKIVNRPTISSMAKTWQKNWRNRSSKKTASLQHSYISSNIS